MSEMPRVLLSDPPTVCEFCGSTELYAVRLGDGLQAIKCCECMALLAITEVTDEQDQEG